MRDGGQPAVDRDALCHMQGDPRWAREPYQGGCDIGSHGCGCCAASMALTLLLGEEVTPDELARRMRGHAGPRGITYCIPGVGTAYAGWLATLRALFPEVEIEGMGTGFGDIMGAVAGGAVVVLSVGEADLRLQDGSTRHTHGHVMLAYDAGGGAIWTKGSAEGPRIGYDEEAYAAIGVRLAFSFSLRDGARGERPSCAETV